MPPMQLERLLQSQGFGSRKECRALVRAGRVAVAGVPCTDPFAEFGGRAPEGLCFSVDAQVWQWHARACVMLNKPPGVECSHQPKHHRSVYTLLPPPLVSRGVQSIGRLDEDTTGLLLFSDDGQFIHAVSSGRRKVAKTYAVTTRHPVDAAQAEALRAGVVLHDDPEPVAAAACRITGSHALELTVTEGRYHQVKRMVAAAGNRVEALRRIAVGGLALPADLAEGAWRWLSADEIAAVLGAPAG